MPKTTQKEIILDSDFLDRKDIAYQAVIYPTVMDTAYADYFGEYEIQAPAKAICMELQAKKLKEYCVRSADVARSVNVTAVNICENLIKPEKQLSTYSCE